MLKLEWTHETTEEAKVGSLLWMGRIFILLSLVVVGMQLDTFRLVWVALVMLAIYPIYLVVYWRAVRVRRTEAVTIAVIAVALGVLYVTQIQLW